MLDKFELQRRFQSEVFTSAIKHKFGSVVLKVIQTSTYTNIAGTLQRNPAILG